MSRRYALGVLATVAAVVGGALVLPSAAHAAAVTVAYTKTQDWGTGFQAQVTITNSGTAALSSWKVEYDFPANESVGTYWDTLMTHSGQHYVFGNREYNGTIAAGASVSFGFTGAISSGSYADPTGCLLNGASCAGGGGGDTQKPTAPTGLHSTSVGSGSVALAWTAATDNVGVTGYDVDNGGTVAATASGTSATVSGLAPSTSYTFTVRARDAAGNVSDPSAAVTVTTSAGGGNPPPPAGSLKLAPYADMGEWPTPSLTQWAQTTGLRAFSMAFVTSAGCHASWFNAYDPRAAWEKSDIDALRAMGGDVTVSFGGASGIELAQACTDVTALTAEYQAVVSAYGLTHVDFDIEGSAVAEPASIARRSQAMARLQQANPGLEISLTLPVLPGGLTADGLNVVASARDAGVNVGMVNGMAMDYYQGTGTNMGAAATQVGQSLHDQIHGLFPGRSDAQVWASVGITPMLGKNDDGSTFTQANARTLVSWANSHHIGRLAYWEEGRDANACTGALYRCTNITQQPFEFTGIFRGFTG
ncbi:MAG: cellulose binding domain-containing protein [Mycobacteriales bacterium]